MNDPSERIQAALLRFKPTSSVAENKKVKPPPEPEDSAPQPVVVNEQNLAALFVSSLGGAYPDSPVRKLATTKGS